MGKKEHCPAIGIIFPKVNRKTVVSISFILKSNVLFIFFPKRKSSHKELCYGKIFSISIPMFRSGKSVSKELKKYLYYKNFIS